MLGIQPNLNILLFSVNAHFKYSDKKLLNSKFLSIYSEIAPLIKIKDKHSEIPLTVPEVLCKIEKSSKQYLIPTYVVSIKTLDGVS